MLSLFQAKKLRQTMWKTQLHRIFNIYIYKHKQKITNLKVTANLPKYKQPKQIHLSAVIKGSYRYQNQKENRNIELPININQMPN